MGKFIKSSYKNIFLLIFFSILLNIQISNQCSICLDDLNDSYLIDVWGNKFHNYHERNGHYCDSCSRLISEGITHGGYKTTDNRYICSLCYPNLVYEKQIIERISSKGIFTSTKIRNEIGFHKLINQPMGGSLRRSNWRHPTSLALRNDALVCSNRTEWVKSFCL